MPAWLASTLRPSLDNRSRTMRLGAALQAAVDGRLDDQLASLGANQPRQALEHGIDRILDTQILALVQRVGKGDRNAGGLLLFLDREQPRFGHLAQHAPRTRARHGRIGCRRELGRRLQQAGEHGGFRQRQLAGRLAEEAPRRRLDAVGAAAEIHAVEIDLEDVALAQAHLQPQGEDQLLQLAAERALRRQEQVLGELLGQCRPALDEPADPQVGQ